MSRTAEREAAVRLSVPAGLRLLGLASRLGLCSPDRVATQAVPKLQDSARAISSAAQELQRGLHQLDRQFEEFGDAVANLSELAGKLLKASEELMVYATGQSDGRKILEESHALINPSMRFVALSAPVLAELGQRIASITGRVKQLIRGEAAIKAAVYPLQFTQVMIRIESAGLPDHLLRVFDGLIGQIATLQERVNLTFTEKCQSLSATLEPLSGLSRLLATATSEYRSASERKQALDGRLHSLDGELVRNESKDIALDGVAAEVSREVNGLVTGVQAHDIVSQKVSHVLANIASFEERIANAATLGDLQTAAQSLRVQILQLRQAHDDLGRVTGNCHDAATQLHSRLRRLSHDCLLLSEFDHLVTSADGAVQVLIDSMSDVREMTRAAADQMSEAHQSIGFIADAVSSLTGSAAELAESMRYIALNAQIQAIHVGAGTALEVLAAETEAIARETNRVSEELTGAIVTVTGDLSQSRSEIGRLQGEAVEHRDLLEKGLETHKGRLHAHRDRTLELFMRVEEILKEIGSEVERAVQAAGFEKLIGPAAAAITAAMENAIRDLDDVLALGPAVKDGEAFDDYGANYTMASERELHRLARNGRAGTLNGGEDTARALRFAGESVGVTNESAATRTAAKQPVEQQLTGGDGNVELF